MKGQERISNGAVDGAADGAASSRASGADGRTGGLATIPGVAADAATLPRELILASAGSGKTFRISSRLIELLARGQQPESILASTFTRKAAGEILDRVLVRLAEAALDDAKARELERWAGFRDAADRGQWLAVLEGLVRSLHRLNIGTLDSFFVRSAGSFAHELALPPGWRIADEPTDRRLRSEAIQEVLVHDGGARVELLRTLNRGGAGRSVHDALLRDVNDFRWILHTLDPDVPDPWAALEPAAGDGRVDPAMRQLLADAIELIEPPATGGGTPSSTWSAALRRIADQVRAGEWEAFLAERLVQCVRAGEAEYSRIEIPEPVRAVLAEAVAAARSALAPGYAAAARAMGRIASLFDEAYSRRQHAEGAFRFEDVTRLIGGPDALGSRPDLFYRLDMQMRHILLDEFQDTSLAQWEALCPLVDELLAGGDARAALVVADPKQSIYAWRGAEPALVKHVGHRYELRRDHLAESWRSSQPVLDVVNLVFPKLADSPVLAAEPCAADVIREWTESFSPHTAARRELPGFVRVAVGPRDPGRGTDRPLLFRRAAELVRDLRAEAPGFSVGVLTRTNQAVARLIHELRRLDVPASEEGGTALVDSAAVTSVLALLRMADHPGDRLARYHVARTAVGTAVGLVDPDDEVGARRIGNRLRRLLLRDGYGPTLTELAGRIAHAGDPREARRLRQLAELAFRHDHRATLRPSDFVRLAEAERVEDPSAADVRVMTVHKAKGLEFDIVVLPELDADLFRGGGSTALPWRHEPAGRVTAVYPYVPAAARPLFPEVDAAFQQHRAAVLRDALSALYVALTRPRYALHVLIAADGAKGPGTAKTAARILRHALAPDREAVDGDEAFYTHGDPRWFDAVRPSAAAGPAPASAPAPAPPAPRLRAPAARSRVLPRRRPSQLEGGSQVDLRRMLRVNGGARERGSLVHAWCQMIEWLDEGLPPADELRGAAWQVAPSFDAAEVESLLDEFRGWLERDGIRRALLRSAYPAGARAEREVPFVHREGEAVVEGIIDRLVLVESGGRVTGAEVLDFKTDELAAGDGQGVAAKVAFYRPQMQAYREAVAAAYGLDPARVKVRLVFLRPGLTAEL